MSVVARLEMASLRPERELSMLMDRCDGEGAVVSFTGLARPRSRSGDPVDELLLEHHAVLTLRSLEAIAEDAAARFDVSQIYVVHRCGRVAAGEPVVFAATSSAHRRAAFEAADYLMDRLKTEAVFWKREIGPSGSQWIEPTQGDHANRERWG